MSDPCPTIDSLIALGFERRTTKAGIEGVGYRFAHLDLNAVHVRNLYARYVVLLSGVLQTRRSLAIIEDQIPNDLGSTSEAAAWVSYALRPHRSDMEPLPDWFFEGEKHWDLVPPARMVREAEERQRAYLAAPRCVIDREYARPLRRNLLEQLPMLPEETGMTFSFDGRVLTMTLCDRVQEVVAYGESWASSYQAIVSSETKLPARFENTMVEVSVFEGHVSFDRIRLGPCEAVA